VISLSFYTMVKSGAPVFVLLFAFLFKLEKPTYKLTGIILLICSGVLLMVGTETQFHWQGYLEVQTATILSGFRWSITQILLGRASLGMTNPLATSLFLSPVMAGSLLAASLALEDWSGIATTPVLVQGGVLRLVGLLCFGGLLAFLMVMAEFQLISVTNVVTFSVAGVFKEVLTIAVSLMVFRDGEFTALKGLGLVISLVGIGIYNYVRIVAIREEKEAAAATAGVGRYMRGAVGEDEGGLLDDEGLWVSGGESDDEAVAAVYGFGFDTYSSAFAVRRGSDADSISNSPIAMRRLPGNE
ncbi:hypothetical protein HDU98_004182, partial [Podochytrium sp. JEL0797]